jgi:hypothetical protein
MFKQSNILLGKGVGGGVFFSPFGGGSRDGCEIWEKVRFLLVDVTMGMSNISSQRCSLNV